MAGRVAGIRVADKVPSKVMRLVKSRLRDCDWGMRQVSVEFDTEAKANKFEDEANRDLGLTGQSDPDNDFTVTGTQDAKNKYTITITW